MTELAPIPLIIRTRLAHAALQTIADECGADILHIKGATVDHFLDPSKLHGHAASRSALGESLTREAPDTTALKVARASTDADVLVRPSHLARFLASLAQNGWLELTAFDTGGRADHATDFWHRELGRADVHRSFPGIRLKPDLAFEGMWLHHQTYEIANCACTVPSREVQTLLLLLNAARNGDLQGSDVLNRWTLTTGQERDSIKQRAVDFDAEVALAASTGDLQLFVGRPEYDSWRLLASGEAGRFEYWRARVRSAATLKDRLDVFSNPFRFKTDRLRMELGRAPTRGEILRSYLRRTRTNVLDLARFTRSSTTWKKMRKQGK